MTTKKLAVIPDAPEGVTLSEALVRWGDPNAAQEMMTLRSEGHYGPFVWVTEEPASILQQQHLSYEQLPYVQQELRRKQQKRLRHDSLREQLEAKILAKLRTGELTATGYDSRSGLDSDRVKIKADRWWDLKVDFDTSVATTTGCTITRILVDAGEAPKTQKVDRTAGKYSPADLEAWYISYVDEHLKAGTAPSLEADWKAAKEVFGGGVPRDAVRKLRKKHAPEEWKRKGRRKSAK